MTVTGCLLLCLGVAVVVVCFEETLKTIGRRRCLRAAMARTKERIEERRRADDAQHDASADRSL